MNFTRREFLKGASKAALAAGLAHSALSGCATIGLRKRSLDETLSSENYASLTQNWDPIYGPGIQGFSRYQGPGDFQGHIRGGAVPGVDYDVSNGTPLVPSMASFLRQISRDPNGSLYVLLVDIFNPSYQISFGHLHDVLVDERYLVAGDVMRYLRRGIRGLGRGEIVALSGNSGIGPREYGWTQPPHLHLSFYYLNSEANTMVYLDPEKYGLDGGKPVFGDGETPLDGEANGRLSKLELTLRNFKEEFELWPKTAEIRELGGTLMEYRNLLREIKGKKILDSKHFQDMKTLLKRVTLQEKRYLPGTRPYTTMLKIMGYSTDEKQEVILTLPFIAPGLEKKYKKPVYEDGMSFSLVPRMK
jgi:hypothetical protein